MSFILNNNIFENIINYFFLINSSIILFATFPKSKKEISNNTTDDKLSGIDIYKIFITLIWLIIFLVLIIKFYEDFIFFKILPFFYYIGICFTSFKYSRINISELSNENKMLSLNISLFYILFFSHNATDIYVNNFSFLSHTTKEYLVIIFMTLKLILFIYCFIINFSIFASNIYNLLTNLINKFKNKINNFLNKDFNLTLYDFYFSMKNSTTIFFILDGLIFTITTPILIIIYLPCNLIIFFLKSFIIVIKKSYKYLNIYFNNSSSILNNILKISTIFSLIIVFIVITYNSSFFSLEVREVFNLISTVVLIPLIYDRISIFK